jgi:SAM-dependent methyltransferase
MQWRRHHALLAVGTLLLAAFAILLYVRDEAAAQRRDAFESVYAQARWGKDPSGKSTSGAGSTMEATALYRVFLQDFLKTQGIRSVVDAGCGDWEFSQAIDWTGIDYLGVDIVASVIEENRRRYASTNVRFSVADIVSDALPPADLLIVKDVLMHLPNADIGRVLAQLPRYRHVLIVNDVDPVSLSAEPSDIPAGSFRRIDLTRPPHSLVAGKVLTWHHRGETKLVLHVARPEGLPAALKSPK